jgi:acyl-CoA thioesterase-2
MSVDASSLTSRILVALDRLLDALALDPRGDDRFNASSEPGRFDRVFGGQLIAQALLAGRATATGKDPQSLHAYFVTPGSPGQPIGLDVDRVRDGRFMSTRRVTVLQEERPLLVAIASFHAPADGPEVAAPPPSVPPPDETPVLQDLLRDAASELRPFTEAWLESPPPIEIRMGEVPHYMGGPSSTGARSHWMRLPRAIGDDPALHAALLAYASDYLLVDMVYRSYPGPVTPFTFVGSSVDHAIWFHRPIRFDRWHLHTQETLALSGQRGLVRGMIHDADGHLVVSVTQEVLVRPNERTVNG